MDAQASPAKCKAACRAAIAAVLLITLAGLGLRMCRLSGQSFWTDEIYSVTTARTPLPQILEMSEKLNNSLPTYFLALRVFVGESNDNIEVRARLLSAIAGALSVPVFMGLLYLWGRGEKGESAGWGPALAGGALLAANPLHLWYSQDTRAYALMLFLGLLAMLAFELARHGKRRWCWALYFVSSLGAIGMHKTAFLFPCLCGAWHFLQVRRNRERFGVLFIHAAILATAAAVLMTMKNYPPRAEYSRPGSIMEVLYTMATYVGGYSFGPSLVDVQSYGAWGAVKRNEFQLAVAGAVLLVLAAACARRLRDPIFLYGLALLILDLAVVCGYSELSHFPYNVRYTLPALVGFVAMAATAAGSPGILGRGALIALLGVSLWADAQWFTSEHYRKQDSRAVAQWLIENEGRVQTWTMVPDYQSVIVKWYLSAYGHPEISARIEPAKSAKSTTFPPVPDVFILGRRDHTDQPDQIVAAYKAAAGNTRTAGPFNGYEVYERGQ